MGAGTDRETGQYFMERLAHVAQARNAVHGQRRRSLKKRPSPRLTWRVRAVTSVLGGIRSQRRAVYLSGGGRDDQSMFLKHGDSWAREEIRPACQTRSP